MHLYDVTAAGQSSVFIFAMSIGDAVNLFTAFWLLNRDCYLPDVQVKQADPSLICDREHLREALTSQIVGIGIYRYDHGWTIYPPAKFEEIADAL